ncbi:MAG: hypothetical protein V5A56_05460 [Halolamina sp.]
MSDDRPTVRPVTLARLVELTHVCGSGAKTTEQVETELDVTHRRARETILEAQRIDLIKAVDPDTETTEYVTSDVGGAFLEAVQDESWSEVSDILEIRSPHYGAFLEILEDEHPIKLGKLLEELDDAGEFSSYTFNQTSVEVVGDWAERLGRVHRNAFSGAYYPVTRSDVPENFPYILLASFDELESSAGVDLRQRYISIPDLREIVCEQICCRREAFDDALIDLVGQNVGKLELSGAPIDTGAKEARFGIKEIDLAGEDGLVSTSQSTDRVMAGVEQFDKQYYYLAVHDCDLTYTPETKS